jgi:hypothetical protein
MTTITATVTARTAIFTAEITGATLCCYSAEGQDSREGLSLDEAREICCEDSSRVYCYASIDHGDLRARVKALLDEACRAGDPDTVRYCHAALNGNGGALGGCLGMMLDAADSNC